MTTPSKAIVVGAKYGEATVLQELPDNYFLVSCGGCGAERKVWKHNVLRQKGYCRRCAARRVDTPSVIDPATGKTRKEYAAWSNMVARTTVSMPSWHERFGGTIYAGMEVEPSWLGPSGFAEFFSDVGPAPTSEGRPYYLDRIDNAKGYVLGNVRWASASESNKNKKNARWLTAHGLTKTIQEWADDAGISSTAIRRRIDLLGWSVEDAVSTHSLAHRPTNDLYYMAIAGRVSKRSTCARRAVGCVLVDKHYRVISTSYNSVAKGVVNCTSKPCSGASAASGQDLHLCQAKHAEELALIKCNDVYSVYTCYVTTAPCVHCVRRLLDTSCSRIVFSEDYAGAEASAEIWRADGREWVQLPVSDEQD